jgi:putative protease
VTRNSISFQSSIQLDEGFRLRIRNINDNDQQYVKVENFTSKGNLYQIPTDLAGKIKKEDDVLLVRLKTESFSSRLGNINTLPELKKQHVNKLEIRNSLVVSMKPSKPMLMVRIGSPEWIAKLRFEDYDAVILSYKKSDWENFDPNATVFQVNRQKTHIELPKFISENSLEFYRNLAAKLAASGFNQFFISHLSQKMLLPKGAKASCNENVYVLNDASAKVLLDENISEYIYPLENDLENLLSMKNKQGIVPLYFYPELFYSRMPVKSHHESKMFADENNKKFRIAVKDGITIVYPTIPVALFQYRNQLEKNGFNRFLIDYSGEIITANIVKRILKKFIQAEAVQPSTSFNFKLGLK